MKILTSPNYSASTISSYNKSFVLFFGHRNITIERKDDIIKMMSEGKTYREIADEIGCTSYAISQALRKKESKPSTVYEIRRNKYNELLQLDNKTKNREEIIRMYTEQNMSIEEIRKETLYSLKVIMKILKDAGVYKRKK